MADAINIADIVAVSISRAAQVSGFSERHIYREAAAGRLKILKSGRRSIITMQELARYISSLPALTKAA